jgi:hydroxyacylglutathione hydrolase
MTASLQKLASLPDSTSVYFGHEYTEKNLAFAAAVESDNSAIKERTQRVREMRAAGLPSVPSKMSEEHATNPFLRTTQPGVIETIRRRKEPTGSAVDVFVALRRWKDHF